MENLKFFVGIDLGGERKKTTGLCLLESKNKKIQFSRKYCLRCRDLKPSELLRILKPFLKNILVIAVDGPLTLGPGKGKLRLYEKFLLKKIFRQEKISPLPPALMPELTLSGQALVRQLKNFGFSLDRNLIETFPTFVRKISPNFLEKIFRRKKFPCQSPHQRDALICAAIAFFHSNFKTCFLGYKDGFLFLPEISFWKREWQKKFSQAWKEKEYLKYRHLVSNIFQK